MRHPFHGTQIRPDWHHPILDYAFWKKQFPLDGPGGDGGWIDCPGELVRVEQVRELALSQGDLGPCVPADFFVWADAHSKLPWLTKIGGIPWRPQAKPWPFDAKGNPLAFLGQICFADSAAFFPFELPGAVALIFGTFDCGYASIADGGAELEWSSLKIDEPQTSMTVPGGGRIPVEYSGGLHRSVQYTNPRVFGPRFQTVGMAEGGRGIGCVQATAISTHGNLPQDWPFDDGDGKTLVATLNSFYFREKWPLVDVPFAPHAILHNGIETRLTNESAFNFSVGDAGCIWIYRDGDGTFGLDESCG